MNIWAWIGFITVAVVVYGVMIAIVARLVRSLSTTTAGLIMLAMTAFYTAGVTWAVAERVLCQ